MIEGTKTGVADWGRRLGMVALRLMLMSACLLCASVSEAKPGRVYKVEGTIIAITLSQTPPLIVVKTPLAPHNHMTVGATVTKQTRIFRGKKRVTLATLPPRR